MKRFALALFATPLLFCSVLAQDKVTEISGNRMGEVHLINDVAYKGSLKGFNIVVEIPVGTWEKWGVGKKDGRLHQQFNKGKPREIKFLAYPANYGFFPQTIISEKSGGEGGPVDVFLLDSLPQRGDVVTARIIGGFEYSDNGTKDHKLLAVTFDGPFRKIKDLSGLFLIRPGVIEIIKLWVDNFKGPGKMHFERYLTRPDAERLLETAHSEWQAQLGLTNEP
jgi:inorganic pyrophosphatase